MTSGRTAVRVGAAVFGVAALAAIVVFASQEGLDGLDKLASVVGAIAGIASLWVAVRPPRWLRTTEDPPTRSVDQLARLATAVTEFWEPEEERRRLRHPEALPVSWTTEPPPIADHWANVRRDGHEEPLDLAGSVRGADVGGLASLVANPALRGRIVILGAPGSGKTSLLLRMVLAGVARRAPDDPVPVLLRLSTWNPAVQSLEVWIRQRLDLDYGYSSPIGVAQLLPVLDGLDELPKVVQAPALRTISTAFADRPLVLTSRIDEYQAALTDMGQAVVAGAAVVRLSPLSPADTTVYLSRAAPPAHTPVWEAMFARDRAEHGGALVAALDTPLLVSLVRGAYADRPSADVGELLAFADDHDALHGHLLDQVLVTAYPDPPEPGQRWTRDQARRWLSFLAVELCAHRSQDIAWWEIRRHSAAWYLVVVLASACVTFVGWRLLGIPGLSTALVGFSATVSATPTRGRIKLARSTKPWQMRLVTPLIVTLYATLGVAAVSFVVLWLTGEATTIFDLELWQLAAAFGVVWGVLFGGMAEFTTLVADADVRAATDPLTVLRDDRRDAIGFAVLFVGFLVAGIGGQTLLSRDFPYFLVAPQFLGLLVLFATVGALLGHAWTRFLIVRSWLAVRRRLPLRLMTFLEDARARDVLRTAGGVYQFRHALLRDRLAGPVS